MQPADSSAAACKPAPEGPAAVTGGRVRAGVLGGTFDPIHHAHLFIAEQAREQLGLEYTVFVPSCQPPHKLHDPLTSAEHRLAMTTLAVADNPAFRVSRLELDRPGPSYTIDTLRALRAGGLAEPHFILGADAVLEMGSWYQPAAILREFEVVAVAREGSDLGRLEEALGAELAARVRVLEVPLLEISATEIRRRVREGRSIRYLTPPAVVEYIARHGLYLPGAAKTP
jgi:nicotinate-nucleotide adenylyltransferase